MNMVVVATFMGNPPKIALVLSFCFVAFLFGNVLIRRKLCSFQDGFNFEPGFFFILLYLFVLSYFIFILFYFFAELVQEKDGLEKKQK